MAYPPAYTRTTSFTEFETLNPGEPKPGVDLDTEFDNVSNALTATQTNLALIQRADGALANNSVGEDQLQDGLFDDIADDAVADAEAAAAAAASSASAAASSAMAAGGSASASASSASSAAGSAAAAGIAQGTAQTAAIDAGTAADDAGDAADAAELAANSVVNSVSQAQLHEEMAFKWAEYLAAPVAPAPPGWPEAVDDGMFSSKWWALRARDYNTVTHLDFGTAGANVGEAFDIWDAVPGNDLPLGQVFASWGTPPHTYALTDPSDPSDPASWTDTTGGPGPAGPPNTLTIGSVTSGTPAAATITGTSPNQVLSLTIPPGATGATGATGPAGATGAAGPANTLSIGTVTTGAPGSAAGATITGAAPNQTLSLTIPRGDVGATGATGATGPAGPTNYANPTAVIGLTAVNGSLSNTMRSDAAPPLSQAIVPTWTGDHTFNATVDLAGPVEASGVEGLNGQVLASQGAGLPLVFRNAGSGSIELGYNFSTAVGTADPGNQKMSLNSAVYASVTQIQFDDLAFGNFDAQTILSLLTTGNRIYIQARADASRAVVYEVTGPGTDNGGHWSIPVTMIQSRGLMFAANSDLNCVFILSSSSVGVANPTASIGMTVVNGSATTAMRSDAAPPINPAIIPTWTGQHTFTALITQLANAGGPVLKLTDTDAGTDATNWRIRNNGGQFIVSVENDGGTEQGQAFNFARSAAVITTMNFGNPTHNPAYNFLGTGTTTLGGSLSVGDSSANGDRIRLRNSTAISAANLQHYFNLASGTQLDLYPYDGTLTTGGKFNIRHAQVYFADGTNALPVVSFAADTDSGLFRQASNVIGVSLAAVERVRFSSGSIPLRIMAADTVGDCLLGFYEPDTTTQKGYFGYGGSADDNMHIWNAEAANIVLGTNGATRLTIDSAGGLFTAGATGGSQGAGTINATGLYVNGVAVSGGSSSGANPTASVGLTAVNGSATTFMRSDGAPALDQGITPTWTGRHTFTDTALILSNAGPSLRFLESDQATDEKMWVHLVNAKVYTFRTAADNAGAQSNIFVITRGTLGAISSIAFGNAADAATFDFLGGGAVTLGGALIQSNAAPQIRYTESDQALDEKSWNQLINGKVFTLRASNDAFSAHSNFLSVTRGTGTAIASMAYGNATDNPTHTFLGSGNTTFNGGVVLGAPTGGNKGVGTLNATGLYINNVAVTAPPAAANPTASVGTSAVFGSASTFMRSDAAPPISLTISPSWSGSHTFTGTHSTTGGPISLFGATSTGIYFNVSGQAVDGRAWIDTCSANTRAWNIYNDAGSAGKGYMGVTRTLNVVSSMTFGNATDNPTFTFLGTGTVSAASFTTTSARAGKRETGKPSGVRAMLSRLRPLLYRLLDGDDREQLGLIAEEVHEVCPQLSDGKTVAYDRLAILLLAAWQEERA